MPVSFKLADQSSGRHVPQSQVSISPAHQASAIGREGQVSDVALGIPAALLTPNQVEQDDASFMISSEAATAWRCHTKKGIHFGNSCFLLAGRRIDNHERLVRSIDVGQMPSVGRKNTAPGLVCRTPVHGFQRIGVNDPDGVLLRCRYGELAAIGSARKPVESATKISPNLDFACVLVQSQQLEIRKIGIAIQEDHIAVWKTIQKQSLRTNNSHLFTGASNEAE